MPLRRFIPLLAFAALAWLLLQVRPPQLLVTLGPQRSVVTRNALAGMHTRFVEEAEAWKIKRGLEMVREMGAPWIVEFFPWAYYEKTKGQRDFSGADRIVDHANRQGLTVVARLGFTPEWARPPNSTFTHLDPPHYSDFADFAAAFAAHFRGRVSHFIIWNEPNLQNEWGMRRVDPAAYMALLRVVYPAIKQINPDAIVLAGALAPTTERNRDVALSDLEYLEEMYEATKRQTQSTPATPISHLPWDALAVHSYGTTMPPEEPPAPDKINFRRVELLRTIMIAHGDDSPIYITEAGWNDDVNWVNGVTPAQRIDYTIRALDYAQAHWPWVRCVAFWVFKLPAPARGYRDHFTFVTPSLEPLPIYEEVRRGLVP
ncbi:MAG: hypothetical protein ACFLMY_05320 [Candidatus Brachytrichaceae bacterium NZ_4S206]|jgi:hypothetical protein